MPFEHRGAGGRGDVSEAETRDVEARALADQVGLGAFRGIDARVQVPADRLGERLGPVRGPALAEAEGLGRLAAGEGEAVDALARPEARGDAEVVEQAGDVEQLGIVADAGPGAQERAPEVGPMAVPGQGGGGDLLAEGGGAACGGGVGERDLREGELDLPALGEAELAERAPALLTEQLDDGVLGEGQALPGGHPAAGRARPGEGTDRMTGRGHRSAP